MAGSEVEAGHVNMVSGNLGFVLTVPGQQRPWPQRHKEKRRVTPSDDDKKDLKVGREEKAKMGRRDISLLFIKGKWMLPHWGRRAENAKSFSIPKGIPDPAPQFIYESPHSVSLALCWAPGKQSLFFSPRRSWSGGWQESKLMVPPPNGSHHGVWRRAAERKEWCALPSLWGKDKSLRSAALLAHPPAGLWSDDCLCQP